MFFLGGLGLFNFTSLYFNVAALWLLQGILFGIYMLAMWIAIEALIAFWSHIAIKIIREDRDIETESDDITNGIYT